MDQRSFMPPTNNTQAIQNIESENRHNSFTSHWIAPWTPIMVLAGVLAIVSLLGSTDKPSDDVNWLRQLARSGDSNAQLQLGLDYRDGRLGLTTDSVKGLKWLLSAAEQGDAYAEDAVGTMYAKGSGVARNPERAMYWWSKSMRNGNKQARLHLSEALIQAGKVQQAEALLR
jgi:hypothetical protein